MKAALAFAVGAVVAAGAVYFAMRKEAPPAPAVQTAAVAPAPASAPLPEATPAPTPEPQPTPAPTPVRQARASRPSAMPRPASPALAVKEAPAAVETPAPKETAAAQPPPSPPPPPAREPEPARKPEVLIPTAPPPPPPPNKVTVPAGHLLTVRLQDSLSADRNQAGDSFTATLDQPLIVEGFVLAERGARVDGRVVSATPAGRVKGTGEMSVELVRLHTADGQKIDITTESFAREGESSRRSDAAKIGAAAAIGAAIGAIAGGGKGAAIGAGVGGGAGAGTVLGTRGKGAQLPSETRLTFKLSKPVTVVEKR